MPADQTRRRDRLKRRRAKVLFLGAHGTSAAGMEQRGQGLERVIVVQRRFGSGRAPQQVWCLLQRVRMRIAEPRLRWMMMMLMILLFGRIKRRKQSTVILLVEIDAFAVEITTDSGCEGSMTRVVSLWTLERPLGLALGPR